jgi:hypothetical protein
MGARMARHGIKVGGKRGVTKEVVQGTQGMADAVEMEERRALAALTPAERAKLRVPVVRAFAIATALVVGAGAAVVLVCRELYVRGVIRLPDFSEEKRKEELDWAALSALLTSGKLSAESDSSEESVVRVFEETRAELAAAASSPSDSVSARPKAPEKEEDRKLREMILRAQAAEKERRQANQRAE